MDSALSTVASVFRNSGWSVTHHDELRVQGLSFDFIAESEAAVLFAAGAEVDLLKESTRRLVAEVAAVTQRRSAGVKAWEAYLLLACTGDLLEHENAVQSVQHDLAYCRKIVISADEIETAQDPHSAAQRLVAFLLPLRPTDRVLFTDVRRALAQRLEAHGVDGALAAELVGHFDESSCRCGERMKAFVGDDSGRAE
jgi:hypothetical protein